MAAGLAVFFLLSSQAMPNYWYLVAVVAVFGSQAEGWQQCVASAFRRTAPSG